MTCLESLSFVTLCYLSRLPICPLLELQHSTTGVIIVKGPFHSPIIGTGMARILRKFTPIVIQLRSQTIRREMLRVPLWPDLSFFTTGLGLVSRRVPRLRWGKAF